MGVIAPCPLKRATGTGKVVRESYIQADFIEQSTKLGKQSEVYLSLFLIGRISEHERKIPSLNKFAFHVIGACK